MSNQQSEAYKTLQSVLEQIKRKLVEASTLDLSNMHVGHEWSWLPHVKDHLEFLAEQVAGLSDNLYDAPPPEMPEDIKTLREAIAKSQK